MSAWSVRRIAALTALNGGQRYLEVGIASGRTFNGVTLPDRTGVDVSLAPYEAPDEEGPGSARLLQMRSDDFFRDAASGRYDLVFLDGLHTAEQTFRDFCASLPFSGPRTIWLIDDTLPVTALSAIPDRQRWKRVKTALGSEDPSWHGDVFRTTLMIRSAFPRLRVATITDRGNPQTVVWHDRAGAVPLEMTWQALAHVDYFDLVDDPSLLQCATEAEVLALVEQSLRSADAGQGD